MQTLNNFIVGKIADLSQLSADYRVLALYPNTEGQRGAYRDLAAQKIDPLLRILEESSWNPDHNTEMLIFVRSGIWLYTRIFYIGVYTNRTYSSYHAVLLSLEDLQSLHFRPWELNPSLASEVHDRELILADGRRFELGSDPRELPLSLPEPSRSEPAEGCLTDSEFRDIEQIFRQQLRVVIPEDKGSFGIMSEVLRRQIESKRSSGYVRGASIAMLKAIRRTLDKIEGVDLVWLAPGEDDELLPPGYRSIPHGKSVELRPPLQTLRRNVDPDSVVCEEYPNPSPQPVCPVDKRHVQEPRTDSEELVDDREDPSLSLPTTDDEPSTATPLSSPNTRMNPWLVGSLGLNMVAIILILWWVYSVFLIPMEPTVKDVFARLNDIERNFYRRQTLFQTQFHSAAESVGIALEGQSDSLNDVQRRLAMIRSTVESLVRETGSDLAIATDRQAYQSMLLKLLILNALVREPRYEVPTLEVGSDNMTKEESSLGLDRASILLQSSLLTALSIESAPVLVRAQEMERLGPKIDELVRKLDAILQQEPGE